MWCPPAGKALSNKMADRETDRVANPLGVISTSPCQTAFGAPMSCACTARMAWASRVVAR